MVYIFFCFIMEIIMKLINTEINYTDKILIKWDDKFLIGIPVIDEQHKKLIQSCEDFYQALMAGKEKTDWQDSLTAALKNCVDYVRFHFSSEEKLMLACGFEFYSQHKIQHEDFIRKVLELSSSSNSWNYKSAMEFVFFLYNWILTHIGHTDRLYVNQLKEYILKQNQK